MESKTETVDIVKVLAGATQSDLDRIDQRITELSNELDGLSAARKAINLRLNGKPARKKPVKKGTGGGRVAAESDDDDDDADDDATPVVPATNGEGSTAKARDRVFEYLTREGPQSSSVIANKCSIALGSITYVLKHEWFTKGPQGWEIAK